MNKESFLSADSHYDDWIAIEEMIFEAYMAGHISYDEVYGFRELLLTGKDCCGRF